MDDDDIGRFHFGSGRDRSITTGWPTHRARDRSRRRHKASTRRRRQQTRRWAKRHGSKREAFLT